VTIKAPFPWFGGKSKVTNIAWQFFGDTPNYVEPFFGSGAVLLGRPDWSPENAKIETVNDLDGFVANFWRAVKADPENVAHFADWPVNENDLHARHVWLKDRRALLSRCLEGDPDFFDAKIAGWWVWGMSIWIGCGFCGDSGSGPWGIVEDENGRKLVHLGDAGRGVSRKRVHLGNGNDGLISWMTALSERLRRVRVCSGDWSRVCGPTPTVARGVTAVFLDPPYSAEADRDMNIYSEDSGTVAHDVRRWAIEQGTDARMRIILCGYRGEHDDDMLSAGWTFHQWKAHGGYGNQGNIRGRENAKREVLWISPHCLKPERAEQKELFA